MKLLFTGSLMLGLVCAVLAQTRTITGSGNWSTANRWQGNQIGGASDNDDAVVMNNELNITIQNGQNYTIASFTVGKEGSLTINAGGSLTITGLVTVDKAFTINVNGSITVEGNMNVDKELTLNVGSTGSFTVEQDVVLGKDASLDVQGDMTVDGDFSTDKEAVVNVGGTGSLDVGGELDLGDGSTITGSGDVSAGDCTGASCEDDQINSTLPITLGSFSAMLQGATVVLQWNTLSEVNFDYFEIQRANMSGEFRTLSTLKGNGTSKVPIQYGWTDERPQTGINYYRLISNDFDGYREIFPSQMIVLDPANLTVDIYPNPAAAGDILQIEGSTPTTLVQIYSVSGLLLQEEWLDTASFRLDTSLKPGVYIIRLILNGLTETKRLIIH